MTDVYPHIPILRVASALDESASTRATRMIKPLYELYTSIFPILGFWGSKVPQNGRFPAQDADEPPCKIWRRCRFILGGEIRIRTNTHKHVNDISTPCLSACVDNERPEQGGADFSTTNLLIDRRFADNYVWTLCLV